MNSYKLGFSLIAAIVILTVYWNSKPTAPIVTLPASTPPIQPSHSAPKEVTTGFRTATLRPADTSFPTYTPNDAALDTLLAELAVTMQELNYTQQQFSSMITPDSSESSDELITQMYQPRLDALAQQFETQLRQAEKRSKQRTQQFVWQQILAAGLEEYASNIALSMISSSLDPALFEEMLLTLSNTAINGGARATLAFSILLPPETTYSEPSLQTATPLNRATPRQKRIQQFLEEQFPQETNVEVLNAYLHVYQTMSKDQHGLVSAAQFQQQLDISRPLLQTAQYFSYRIDQLRLTDPNADVGGLLRDLSTTAMDAAEYQNIIFTLNNTVMNDTTQPFPTQHQQLLLPYLQSNLPKLNWQDRYALYQYGVQAYVIEWLKHGTQATDTYYQRIVSSTNPTEQAALLIGANQGGETLMKRLQQNTAFQQQLAQQARQPNLSSDAKTILQENLQMLRSEPDITPDAMTTEETMPDSEPPAPQYLVY